MLSRIDCSKPEKKSDVVIKDQGSSLSIKIHVLEKPVLILDTDMHHERLPFQGSSCYWVSLKHVLRQKTANLRCSNNCQQHNVVACQLATSFICILMMLFPPAGTPIAFFSTFTKKSIWQQRYWHRGKNLEVPGNINPELIRLPRISRDHVIILESTRSALL